MPHASRAEHILLLLPLGLAALGLAASSEEASSEKPLDVRMLSDQRILLSRERVPLAALRVRRLPEAGAPVRPIVASEEDWAAVPLLAQGKEDVRAAEWPLLRDGKPEEGNEEPGGENLSVLLRVQAQAAGVRVMISPALTETVGRRRPPPGHAPPLELAVELYPALKQGQAASWPELTAVDAAGSGALAGRDDALPKLNDTFRATRISFAAKDRPRVEIARSAPARWTLTRQDHALLLRQALLPDPREPSRPGSFELYFGAARDGGGPELSPVRLNKRQTPAWDFLEGSVRVYAAGADPYGYEELAVMAEIAFPEEGNNAPRLLRLPCFFREGTAGAPAEGEFRFRFAPPREGTYGVRLVAVAPGGIARGEALSIHAGPPASRGFVRVKPGERVLRFDDGRVFLPVGLNLGWPGERGAAEEYRRWFVSLARNGGTAARLWLSSWGLPLEKEKAGSFDPEVAEALDEIFTAAQARDVHLILAAENAHDLTAGSAQHPYFREKGGPLLAASEFFRDAAAQRHFKRRLTYLAARYGAYRSLMTWELLNEADEAWPALKIDPDGAHTAPGDADRARAARRDVLAWAGAMAQHLEGMDGHAHAVTLSTALPPDRPWNGLETDPRMTLIQAHGYIPEAADAREDRVFDEAGLLATWASASREPGRPHRPFLLGEFGYSALPDSELNKGGPELAQADRNARDREGLLLHNSMLAGLAAGLASTPMHWWWDRYVERHNLWPLFKAPALFAEALAELSTREGPSTLRWVTNESEMEKNSGVRVLGRAGRQGLCVWVQDRRSTWARSLERREPEPPEITALELRLPALDPGAYRVRWLDTWKGEALQVETLTISPASPPAVTMELKCPPFRRDVAVLIEAVK